MECGRTELASFSVGRLLSHEEGEEVLSKGEKKVGAKTDQLKRLICFFLESEVRRTAPSA